MVDYTLYSPVECHIDPTKTCTPYTPSSLLKTETKICQLLAFVLLFIEIQNLSTNGEVYFSNL